MNQPSRLRDPSQRMQMQNVVPTANLRFNEALDKMEMEINNLRDVLKRDLALHRVKERKKAEEASQPPKPPKPVAEAPVKQESDVIMTDAPKHQVSSQSEPAPVTTRVAEPVQQKEEAMPTIVSPPPPAPVAPMVAPMVASAPNSQPATLATTQDGQEQQPEQPLEEMDFSEFFGDDNMDLQVPEAANTQDDTQLEPLADFSNDPDVQSLLPGLDAYANAPGDTAMPDMPTTTAPDQSIPADAIPDFDFGDLANAAEGDGNAQQDANAQPDFSGIDFSNFDAADTGGGNIGDGQGDNTFDDLFDMDQYDFGGGGDSGGGEDINDWMKNL